MCIFSPLVAAADALVARGDGPPRPSWNETLSTFVQNNFAKYCKN
jgi:hypothetical protein